MSFPLYPVIIQQYDSTTGLLRGALMEKLQKFHLFAQNALSIGIRNFTGKDTENCVHSRHQEII